MKDLRDWLQDGDPVANEPRLSDTEAQRMRHAIVNAGESSVSTFSDWMRASWAAATVAIALAIAVSMSRSTPSPEIGSVNREVSAPAPQEPVARRQMQLIAPGGTRVIWIFNDDFNP